MISMVKGGILEDSKRSKELDSGNGGGGCCSCSIIINN